MTPLMQMLFIAALSIISGLAIGWRLGARRRKKQLLQLQQESGQAALELLETRQHLKKISRHLKNNMKKDAIIKRLRAKQKSANEVIVAQAKIFQQKEKEFFIHSAKMKLDLMNAQAAMNGASNTAHGQRADLQADLRQIHAARAHRSAGKGTASSAVGLPRAEKVPQLSPAETDRVSQ